jgi:hypothetical protein
LCVHFQVLVGYLLHPCFLYLLTESYLYFDFFSIVGSEYGILHFVYGLYVYVVVDYCLVVSYHPTLKMYTQAQQMEVSRLF